MEFAVGQGLGGSHGNAVAGMDAHGVEVLDGADDDTVVGMIAHDLHLVLLPAKKGLLDQNLRRGGGVEAGSGKLFKLFAVVGHTTSGAPQSEGGSDNEGKVADFRSSSPGLFHGVCGNRACAFEADFGHAFLEELAILAFADGFDLGPDQLDLMTLEGTRLVQCHGGVEGGLTAQGWQ